MDTNNTSNEVLIGWQGGLFTDILAAFVEQGLVASIRLSNCSNKDIEAFPNGSVGILRKVFRIMGLQDFNSFFLCH